MRKLVWLDSAVDDLVRLKAFIAKENQEASKRVVLAIKEMTIRLRDYPLIGKPVEDLPDYRDISVRFGAGGYILRYRFYENSLYIVHLRHYRELDFMQ